MKVAATIKLTGVSYPHHIGLSPDGTRLVVAVPGENLSGGHQGGHGAAAAGALILLEASTGRTLATRRLPVSNHNGAFSRDGSAIWTAQMGMPGVVLVLDPLTLETTKEIPVGAMPAEVTLSSDGRYVFAANGQSDDVSVIDAGSKVVVKTIAVGDNPVGAWPGANNVMYVDNEAGKTITAIDAVSLAVTQTFELNFMPGMAALAPGKDEIWVTNVEGGSITFWSVATATRTGEVTTGAGAHGIVFSASGSHAFVTNQDANTLSVLDVSKRQVVATVELDGKPNGLVFRSDSGLQGEPR